MSMLSPLRPRPLKIAELSTELDLMTVPVAQTNFCYDTMCKSIETIEARRVGLEHKPEPWPYRDVGYHWSWHGWTEGTVKRFDANSKLIVVEGNIGSGKSTLARDIAEQLDFHFIPEFSMDNILINGYGIDRRSVYNELPASCRIPDINMFYDNPYNPYNAKMQWHMLFGKVENYCNALAHIMNTVFRYYHLLRKYVLPRMIFWPHLVIYLDVKPEDCLNRIKKRGIAGENNGKVIDLQYLKTIEDSYKDLIKDYNRNSEILAYNWETAGEVERVIEDIEQLDLDWYDWHDGAKFEAWNNVPDDFHWNGTRWDYTEKRWLVDAFENMPTYEVDELHSHPEETMHTHAVFKKKVFGPYIVGYNADKGDSVMDIALHAYDKRRRFDVHRKPWYEYFYRDAWWATQTHKTNLDVKGDMYYNPYYMENHKHHPTSDFRH